MRLADGLEFGVEGDEGDHDFGLDIDVVGGEVAGGFEDGSGCTLVDFREGDGEADAAVTEHGVEFVEFGEAALDAIEGDVEGVGDFGDFVVGGLGEEFVEGRVEEADRSRGSRPWRGRCR